jgi:hypothetical protein
MIDYWGEEKEMMGGVEIWDPVKRVKLEQYAAGRAPIRLPLTDDM